MHIQNLHIDEEIDLRNRMLVCVCKHLLLIEFACNFCMVQVACAIKRQKCMWQSCTDTV